MQCKVSQSSQKTPKTQCPLHHPTAPTNPLYPTSFLFQISHQLLLLLRRLLLHPPKLMKHPQIKRYRISQPRSPLRVIPVLILMVACCRINRIRMNERTQRTAIYDEPGDEGSELSGREEIYFEHGDGVRSDRFFPESVDAELGDCEGLG